MSGVTNGLFFLWMWWFMLSFAITKDLFLASVSGAIFHVGLLYGRFVLGRIIQNIIDERRMK